MNEEGIPLEVQKRAFERLGADPKTFQDQDSENIERERPQTNAEKREIYKSIIRDWAFNQFQPLLESLKNGIPLTQDSHELQSIIMNDIHTVLDETDPLYHKTYRKLIGKIPTEVILLIDKIKQRLSNITDVSTAEEQYQILSKLLDKIRNLN